MPFTLLASSSIIDGCAWMPANLGGEGAVQGFLLRGFDFDLLYNTLFVRPFVWLAEFNRGDFFDGFPAGLAALARESHEGLRKTQTGRLRGYAAGIVLGAVVIVALVVFL